MKRLIKKYGNRKLYDTKTSKYVNLNNVMQMVKEGNEIQVICNNTKEDMTHKVLTQVIANDSMLVLGNVDVLTKMIRNVSNEEEIFKENKDAQKTT